MSSHETALFALDKLIDAFEHHFHAVSVFAASRWSHTGWRMDKPIENEFEISMTLSGTRVMRYGSEEMTCRPGDFTFWDSLVPGTLDAGYFTYSYIIFNVSDDCPERETLLRIFHDGFAAVRTYACSAMDRHYAENLFLNATTELIARQHGSRLSAKLGLLQVMISIRRFLQGSTGGSGDRLDRKQTDLITDLIGYLTEHLDRRITLGELGERYGKNPRHLNRVFKNVAGSPILHYINKLKIEKAKKLLLSSRMNQLEIALELGLRSGQYFNHFFRKETGITPSQYRKSLKLAKPGKNE